MAQFVVNKKEVAWQKQVAEMSTDDEPDGSCFATPQRTKY
jgi:hypothetical protein